MKSGKRGKEKRKAGKRESVKTLLKEPFFVTGLLLAVHALVALLCRARGWVDWEWPVVALVALAIWLLTVLLSTLVLSTLFGGAAASAQSVVARAQEKR